jgi:hypothetical protein
VSCVLKGKHARHSINGVPGGNNRATGFGREGGMACDFPNLFDGSGNACDFPEVIQLIEVRLERRIACETQSVRRYLSMG